MLYLVILYQPSAHVQGLWNLFCVCVSGCLSQYIIGENCTSKKDLLMELCLHLSQCNYGANACMHTHVWTCTVPGQLKTAQLVRHIQCLHQRRYVASLALWTTVLCRQWHLVRWRLQKWSLALMSSNLGGNKTAKLCNDGRDVIK